MTTHEINMLSNPAEVSDVIDWLEKVMEDSPLKEAHRLQFRYAVVEAINNCIEHAYRFQPDRPIALACEINTHSVSVTIRDQGNPYKPLDDMTETHLLTDESGRGLGIINAWVSTFQRIRFERCNITHLIRNAD